MISESEKERILTRINNFVHYNISETFIHNFIRKHYESAIMNNKTDSFFLPHIDTFRLDVFSLINNNSTLNFDDTFFINNYNIEVYEKSQDINNCGILKNAKLYEILIDSYKFDVFINFNTDCYYINDNDNNISYYYRHNNSDHFTKELTELNKYNKNFYGFYDEIKNNKQQRKYLKYIDISVNIGFDHKTQINTYSEEWDKMFPNGAKSYFNHILVLYKNNGNNYNFSFKNLIIEIEKCNKMINKNINKKNKYYTQIFEDVVKDNNMTFQITDELIISVDNATKYNITIKCEFNNVKKGLHLSMNYSSTSLIP
jgi:hypothetical protein